MDRELTAEEIKGVRGKYGLTRKAYSQLTGIGEATLARYEAGQKPSKANANLIRASENPRFMADCLRRDGDLLPEKQREQAEKVVYAMVVFDDEEEIVDINEIYVLTLEQEILNEHAASVMADIERLRQEAVEKGDEALSMVYDDMVSYLAQIKPQIIWREYNSKEGIAELKGKIDAVASVAARCSIKAA